MTKTASRCFEHAKHMAEMSNFKRARVGCVVTLHGRVLSAGFNSTKTHPQQFKYNRFRHFRNETHCIPAQIHAETSALVQLDAENIDWGKVDVYVYRLRRDRPHGMAAPCPACRQYMKDLGIKSVWYTTDDGYLHDVIE